MNTILVGYDGSDAAERALARAAQLAEAFSARLVVVSVTTDAYLAVPEPVLEPSGALLVPSIGTGPAPVPGTVARPATEQPLPPEPEELARRELERARMSLAGRGIEAEYIAEVGSPAERLLAVAASCEADLIVVGSREHGLVEHLLDRAVDEAVARRADRDVLLVH